MNTSNARRSIAASLSIAASAAFLAALVTPASAQESIERIEITGSALKRIDAETALPVQVITRQEIEKTGAANVEQFLQAVGVALQGNSNSVVATASGATTGGVSSVSLRGLGSQRTLVLIDGKRVAGGGTPTDSVTVDVNNIPASAIERIEVLKDSASALYGSDAIGGVINFILRKDYRGGEVTAHAELTQHPGGRAGGLNALLGWGDMATQRFNATLIADFRHEDALLGGQRSFAKTGIFPQYLNDTSSGNTFPANFVAADGSFGTRNPSFPNCPGPYSTVSPLFVGIGSRGCRFDPAPLVSLIPKTDQESFFGTLRFGLTSEIEGYGQFSYSHKEQRTVIQPVPISDQFALPDSHPLFAVAPYNGFSTFLLRPSSPYYPDAATQARLGFVGTPDLLVRYRDVLSGNRDITNLSDQTRVVLGAKGSLVGWDYDASFLHIQTDLIERVNGGYPLLTKMLPLLDSGQVNPFGPNDPSLTPGTPAAAAAAQFRGDAYKTRTSIDGVQAKVTHDLMQLAGGPLALAVGAEGRKERFELNPSPEIVIGDISGYGGNFLPVDKSRNVGAGFAEFNVPIVRTLEVTAAARYDHYEGVGSRTSPKLGARWTPTREVLLRGSVGKGFRAPSLTELYQPQTIGVTAPGLNDPLRCGQPDGTGGTNADPRDCVTQFPITLGGNAALEPETSTNRTLGVVLEPTKSISFGIDYWSVDLKNTIIFGVTPEAILADPSKFGSLITRGAAGTGAACAGCPGPITDIFQGNLNFGETKVRGVDLDMRYRIPAAAAGAFTVGMNGTYILKYEVQNIDGTFTSINGMVNPIVNGAGGVIPRWRHYLFLDWSLAPWNVTFAQQFQSGYKDIPGTFDDTDPTSPTFTGVTHPRVSSYQLFHLYGSYTGFANKNLKVTFGIRNLLDKDPPYTNAGGQNYFQSGYDPGYADPRGRTFVLSATYKFM